MLDAMRLASELKQQDKDVKSSVGASSASSDKGKKPKKKKDDFLSGFSGLQKGFLNKKHKK